MASIEWQASRLPFKKTRTSRLSNCPWRFMSLSTLVTAQTSFCQINTEQKPVPRSLVYDLYGVASEEVIDPAAVRARDIASSLNEEKHSPYFKFNKISRSFACKRWNSFVDCGQRHPSRS